MTTWTAFSNTNSNTSIFNNICGINDIYLIERIKIPVRSFWLYWNNLNFMNYH